MAVKIHAFTVLIASAAVGAAVLAGCGTASAPGGGTPGSGGASGSGGPGSAGAKVSLTITVRNGPGPAVNHWTLRCDPPGGTLPDAAAACAKVLAMNHPFAAPPKDRMCPMIMVSDRQIIITGTWFGAQVHRVVIDGGCDLGLFSRLSPIFR